jgi:Ca-activated chloride channel family protein
LHRRPAEVVVKVVAVAATLVLGPLTAFAQDAAAPAQPVQRPSFHSSASLVALNVTVQDRTAKFVRDLQPGDFVVYEDGVKQNVEFFESTRVPVDLIVMLDTSASMRMKMDEVRAAASGFLQTLREGDRGAVVAFNTTVNVLQALTADQEALQRAVRSTAAAGNTSLNTAVYIALKQFGLAAQTSSEVRRQAIVLLSDGADTASAITFDDVVDLARRMGVSIYTVSLRAPLDARVIAVTNRPETEAADYAMRTLAKETGAQAFFPPSQPGALKQIYASIASELASQYSIGYVPVNPAPDGTFRHVNVQVVTRPQLFSRTRLGYIAAAATALARPIR